MYFSAAPPLAQQVLCLAAGVLIGILYDLFYPLRRLCVKHKALLFWVDLLFFALALPLVICTLYISCELAVRPGFLMSMTLGALIYRFGPSKMMRQALGRRKRRR